MDEPALAALVAPRVADLNTAGVQKIVARTGRQKRDIQVLARYGTSYFGWPAGVTPKPFEIEMSGAVATVRADGYSEANKAQYAAAFDAVLPVAIRMANDSRARALRPK